MNIRALRMSVSGIKDELEEREELLLTMNVRKGLGHANGSAPHVIINCTANGLRLTKLTSTRPERHVVTSRSMVFESTSSS